MKNRSLPFIILKVIILNTVFFFTARYSSSDFAYMTYIAIFFVMTINFFFIRNLLFLKHYLLLILLFFTAGFLQDTLLIYLNLIDFKNGSVFPPIWIALLWVLFLGYYGDVFNKMLYFPTWAMSLIGAIGGCFAYYRGLSLIDVRVDSNLYYIVALVWLFFMPFSLKLFLYFKLKKE
jgi:hypothetical protein